MQPIVPPLLDRWFTKRFQAQAPASVDRIAAMLLATDPSGYVACCAAVRDMDQRDAIGAIRTPTLVIAGRHDLATSPDQAKAIAERVPGAELVELDAAHLVQCRGRSGVHCGCPRLPEPLGSPPWTIASATPPG